MRNGIILDSLSSESEIDDKSDSSDDSEPSENSELVPIKWTELKWKNKIGVGLCVKATLFVALTLSICPPFFPQKAVQKGKNCFLQL